MERSTIFTGKTHYKWQFSIAMLVYQRVIHQTSFWGISLVKCWTCWTTFYNILLYILIHFITISHQKWVKKNHGFAAAIQLLRTPAGSETLGYGLGVGGSTAIGPGPYVGFLGPWKFIGTEIS